MSETPQRVNVFFRLTVAACAVFILTIFAMIASAFSTAQSALTQILNEHGGSLIAAEVVAALVLGLVALIVDRRAIVRQLGAEEMVHEPDRVSDELSSDNPEI